VSPVAIDDLDRLDETFKELRTAYEKYFAGVERAEPAKARDTFKSTLRRLTGERSVNTAVRYRLQSLQASLITYENYWNRITRQIEEGTYKRDLFRLERKQALGEAVAPEPKVDRPVETHGEVASSAPAAVPPASLPTPLPRPASAVAPAAPPAAYPEALRKLYDAFVAARSSTGDTKPLSIDALAQTVRKQMAVIKDKYQCERVEFTVAVKDGRAILKATPR